MAPRSAWDADHGVRPDARAYAQRLGAELPDAGAEKWAFLAPACLHAEHLCPRDVRWQKAEPDTPGVVRSAEQLGVEGREYRLRVDLHAWKVRDALTRRHVSLLREGPRFQVQSEPQLRRLQSREAQLQRPPAPQPDLQSAPRTVSLLQPQMAGELAERPAAWMEVLLQPADAPPSGA